MRGTFREQVFAPRVSIKPQAATLHIRYHCRAAPRDRNENGSFLDRAFQILPDIVRQWPAATLRVQHLLHAKCFRADRASLVGSANITHRRIGWITPCNLELLSPARADDAAIVAGEASLMNTSVPATEK
jgi:phosphatidylserine/phosphatidylglycerophosphate/cardiolipin synthase-like enzyme